MVKQEGGNDGYCYMVYFNTRNRANSSHSRVYCAHTSGSLARAQALSVRLETWDAAFSVPQLRE